MHHTTVVDEQAGGLAPLAPGVDVAAARGQAGHRSPDRHLELVEPRLARALGVDGGLLTSGVRSMHSDDPIHLIVQINRRHDRLNVHRCRTLDEEDR
ncbi:hypothetical protein PDTK01_03480 [Phycicoccus sp. DTK01]|nr:hypothetical protein PDTK01_03480 [Phycicoccus sp. DTK01]